jgi:hypothetical protein
MDLKEWISMTLITMKLTTKELELLTTLASDQLFRREFIDLKMPGYQSNSAEMSLGKALVARLRSLVDPGCARRTPSARMAG